MRTIYYLSNTVNWSGEDCLIYWFYNWNEQDDCFIWDEDKLSFNEALEKYPQNQYEWKNIA